MGRDKLDNTEVLTFKVNKKIKDRLKKYCKKHDINLSQCMRWLIEEHII